MKLYAFAAFLALLIAIVYAKPAAEAEADPRQAPNRPPPPTRWPRASGAETGQAFKERSRREADPRPPVIPVKPDLTRGRRASGAETGQAFEQRSRREADPRPPVIPVKPDLTRGLRASGAETGQAFEQRSRREAEAAAPIPLLTH